MEIINLEEGMPLLYEAMDTLTYSLKLNKLRKIKVMLIIHGYGSSGRGGIINVKARQWLNAQVRNGSIRTVVNGEDFDIFNSKARDLKGKYPELEKYIGSGNHGITIIEL